MPMMTQAIIVSSMSTMRCPPEAVISREDSFSARPVRVMEPTTMPTAAQATQVSSAPTAPSTMVSMICLPFIRVFLLIMQMTKATTIDHTAALAGDHWRPASSTISTTGDTREGQPFFSTSRVRGISSGFMPVRLVLPASKSTMKNTAR